MPDSRCPSRRQLTDCLAGSLPPDGALAIRAHLETCEVCRAAWETLDQHRDTSVAGPPPHRPLPELSAYEPTELGQLGEYKLLERLGEGGMGVVYKALHTELDRVVAVKVLSGLRASDEQAAARFQREIKAVAKLEHPHVVRAYDARKTDGFRFLVMEFVAGLDLAELVRRVGPLEAADACEAARQAALGLACAHEHGLVHRDIKPSNLMLTRDGVVKILDLGLARIREAAPAPGDVTLDGQTIGTPDYMAPEQASDSRSADIRADLYSLGCTLYFLLTGRAPFGGPEHGTAVEKMIAHARETPPPAEQFGRDAPPGLVAVMDRLLAKRAADRFSTPAEAAAALGRFTAGNDLVALATRAEAQGRSPQPAPTSLPRPKSSSARCRRRNRAIGAASAVAMLAAVLWLTIGLHRRQKADVAPRPAAPYPVSPGPSKPEPAGWIVLSWTLRGTGKHDLWLFRPDGSQPVQITNDPETFDIHPCFSPDGRRIAFVRGVSPDQSTSLWVSSSNGASARQLVRPASNSERLLSPVWVSNSRICYARDPGTGWQAAMELWEASPDGGEPRVVFRFRDTPIGGAGMATDASPDGGRLAVVASGNRLWPTADVYILDRSGESVETIWEDHPDDRKDARALWSPNGRQIAWHHNFTRGALAETFYYGVGLASLKSDGRWRCRLQPNRAELVTPLAWTPSGSHLLCARMTRDESRATLFLMDCQFQTTRELFQLEVYGWRPGHREFGRLADWAVVPDDIPLGSLSGTGGSRGE